MSSTPTQKTNNYTSNLFKTDSESRSLLGVGFLFIGIIILVNQFFLFDKKLIKWDFIILCIGLVKLLRNQSKNQNWFYFILVGGTFFINRMLDLQIPKQLLWAIDFIAIGTFIIAKGFLNKGQENNTI
ncbi:LiaF transmembrane domain-containing protein [Polluticaenibacter yanchengensis]|uniref:LiaF transmembrane domain-containing protein n=1 Tax=Polluticaenibacter yanchengensis TaxID=3014562 RepID=A0ABT4UGL5_9BACT|nr:hypothetical protein [Chitinophagaceae bacterium LY-5]